MILVCIVIRQEKVFFLRSKSFWNGLFVGGYMLFYSAFAFVAVLSGAEAFQDKNTILFSVLYFILAGITEELVFRGITADLLIQFFLKKNSDQEADTSESKSGISSGVIPAVVTSGIIFSLAHGINIRSAAVSGVLIQMAGSFIMGMFLTAVYYRTGNIYAVIFLHVLNNIAAAISTVIVNSEESISDVISGYGMSNLIYLIPYFAVLIFILRPVKQKEIRNLWMNRINGDLSEIHPYH